MGNGPDKLLPCTQPGHRGLEDRDVLVRERAVRHHALDPRSPVLSEMRRRPFQEPSTGPAGLIRQDLAVSQL